MFTILIKETFKVMASSIYFTFFASLLSLMFIKDFKMLPAALEVHDKIDNGKIKLDFQYEALYRRHFLVVL